MIKVIIVGGGWAGVALHLKFHRIIY